MGSGQLPLLKLWSPWAVVCAATLTLNSALSCMPVVSALAISYRLTICFIIADTSIATAEGHTGEEIAAQGGHAEVLRRVRAQKQAQREAEGYDEDEQEGGVYPSVGCVHVDYAGGAVAGAGIYEYYAGKGGVEPQVADVYYCTPLKQSLVKDKP